MAGVERRAYSGALLRQQPGEVRTGGFPRGRVGWATRLWWLEKEISHVREGWGLHGMATASIRQLSVEPRTGCRLGGIEQRADRTIARLCLGLASGVMLG